MKGSSLMPSPRERMVISAALLIRERGAQPTAIADVLEHSGAPRGSAYHYFPGGRTQLLCEAIDYAGEYVATKIDAADTGLAALDGLVAYYRKQLLRSDYRAGCPVVAVTVEAGDPGKQDQSAPVIDRAAAAFTRWNDLITQRLMADGLSAKRAGELAMLSTTAIEGAIIVARASRELAPLDSVHGQLRELVAAEISERKSSDGR
jgi:AcrR family transcriptional regulator